MARPGAAGCVAMLRRLLRYAEKVYDLAGIIGRITDGRDNPAYDSATVFRCMLVMCLTRMGSVHALAQHRGAAFWKRWVGGVAAGGHTMRRMATTMDCDTMRAGLRQVYTQLKRNKALDAPRHGLLALVLDGHEIVASDKRCCKECSRRTIHTKRGEHIEYYHRAVAAMLLTSRGFLMLDVEMQQHGEAEVTVAVRLLERLCRDYPRAFTVVLADGLYAGAPFFKTARAHHLHVIAVLKDDRRDLVKDVDGLCALTPPVTVTAKNKVSLWWDFDGLTSWPSIKQPVRVVRSCETVSVRRHKDRAVETITTDWLWVTTLPCSLAPTAVIVELGHSRWAIENHGFNELVNEWHVDHVYTHHANAIEAFWLITMFAFDLFHAFIALNIKQALRARFSLRAFARMLLADFLSTLPELCRLPP